MFVIAGKVLIFMFCVFMYLYNSYSCRRPSRSHVLYMYYEVNECDVAAAMAAAATACFVIVCDARRIWHEFEISIAFVIFSCYSWSLFR